MSSQNSVLIDDIDRAIDSEVGNLRFAPALEDRYEADTRQQRSRSAAISGLVALVIYDLFILTDLLLLPDIAAQSIAVRLAVTPFMLIGAWVINRNVEPLARELLLAIFPVVITASILYLMLASRSPLRMYQLDGIILVLIYQIMMQRPRFRFAVGSIAACVMLFAAATFAVNEIPEFIKSSKILVLAAGAFFMLIGCYRLERQHRLSYALSLRNSIEQEELNILSQTDPLTGLGNRRRLDAFLAAAVHEGAKGTSTAVLILDIDKFKLFNDCYGHLAGDECLATIARIAASRLKPLDLAVRYGGEELIFVLPKCTEDEGVAVAERIRTAIENAGLEHKANEGGIVTVSIGVAGAVLTPALPPVDLVAAADAALYVAKQHGRNRVARGLDDFLRHRQQAVIETTSA